MRKLFRLATFRLALLAVSLNGLAGLLILGFLYVNTTGIMERRVDQGIEAERRRLLEDIVADDLGLVESRMRDRIVDERGSSRHYMLMDADGRVLTANFEVGRIEELPGEGMMAQTLVKRASDAEQVETRLTAFRLAGGLRAVIGRDLTEQAGFRLVIEESLAIAIIVTLLLAAATGMATSRAVIRRLGYVNLTASRILHGRIDERVPVTGSGDEFDHLAVNLNDMLDRIGQLMQATREVTDNIAHDLRSPLNRLRSRLELALLPNVPREELEDAVHDAIDEADALLATFEALLTIARLEHVAQPDFRPVQLVALAEDVVDYFAPLAEERGLQLRLGEAEPLSVAGNRHLLFQALSNVVDNAIRYTPSGGHVAVSVGPREGGAAIVVADDGPGIPGDKRQLVLDRFTRLDASRHQPGTGLGLSVVAAVARHHRAILAVEDNRPGLRLSIVFPPRDAAGERT